MYTHRHELNDDCSHGDPAAERALVACSLWLYAGFIGAAVFGAGLILHFGADAGGGATLAIAFAGGLLALGSWTRARAVLERAAPAASDSAEPFGRDRDATPRERFHWRAYATDPKRPAVHAPLQPR